MFRNILIPTDGSKLSLRGIKSGVRLAKSLGARVTGLYVVLPYVPPVYGGASLYHLPGMSSRQSKKVFEQEADKALEPIRAEAKRAGVECATRYLMLGQPWEAILRAARSAKCDAIVMASHGRGGVSGLILGSETTRVLAHSKIPVLVVR